MIRAKTEIVNKYWGSNFLMTLAPRRAEFIPECCRQSMLGLPLFTIAMIILTVMVSLQGLNRLELVEKY